MKYPISLVNLVFQLLIVLAVIGGCKKEDQDQAQQPNVTSCEWDSKTTDHCLPYSELRKFYQYKGDTLYEVFAPNSPSYFFYENRLLFTYYGATGPKSLPYVKYEYNACNQLIRSVEGNAREVGSARIGIYTYGNGKNLKRIDYVDSFYNEKTPAGFELYSYTPMLKTIYRYNEQNELASSDSIILDGLNNIREYWSIQYSWVVQKWQNIPIKPRSNINIAQRGDRIIAYSNDEVFQNTLVDSVFYNEYGFDTLVYSTRRFADGTLDGILEQVRTYTDCRF
jgi:hypothetical protein